MSHLRDMELIELAAGHLPEEAARDVHAHLERCGACRQRFVEFRDVHAVLGAWQVGGEHVDVMPALAEAPAEAPPRTLRLPWVTAVRVGRVAAAVIFGVVAGYGVARLTHSEHVLAVAGEGDVERVLALHVLEQPSPTGLTLAFAEMDDEAREEVSP